MKLMNLGGTVFFGGTGGGVQRYFEHSWKILLFAWPLAEFLPSTSSHKALQVLAQTSLISSSILTWSHPNWTLVSLNMSPEPINSPMWSLNYG